MARKTLFKTGLKEALTGVRVAGHHVMLKFRSWENSVTQKSNPEISDQIIRVNELPIQAHSYLFRTLPHSFKSL
jgi:hypothetical protein